MVARARLHCDAVQRISSLTHFPHSYYSRIKPSQGFVFLVGGFAESVYLQRAVREALATEDGGMAAELLVPAKPVQCVNRGAAVWGLYPNSFSE